ncbi:hypothetical protein AKJ57_03060 [candidate division MSBL1 archaeon SCGC-AAA259A05]|uniref:Uncharacterized protein n=1 Tax=candidate division MSBL1 archaeon SCGC-AAA259A05 TaxID=1698259 RepID=A0A133U9X2_9EURY|nr:hypothetical protein AKJ57_03060 [candidate division MSBL1 archaeon SCGC-AAA259A05]
MEKLAKYWEEGPAEDVVKCLLCPRECVIPPGDIGYCRGRKNRDGKLYTINYGEATSANPDPIEKKPLYHFHPGSRVFSMSTAGCNFECKHCFPPETPVFTNTGVASIKKIFESSEDSQVLTHKNQFSSIEKCFKHDYNGEIVNINPFYLPPVRCTPEHEFFATKNPVENNIRKVKASELTRNHFLLVPKAPFQNKERINIRNILEKYEAAPFKRDRKVSYKDFVKMKKMKAEGRTSKEIGNSFSLHPSYVRTLFVKERRKGKETFKNKHETSVVEKDGRVRFKNEKNGGLSRRLEITPFLARLLGIYCAEGCVRKVTGRANAFNIVLSFGPDERELIDETKKLFLKVFGVEPAEREETTARKLSIGRTSLAILFKVLCGDKAENKRVPPFIFSKNKSIVGSFLRGYFDGDGSFKEKYADASTVSKKLALGVYQLLLNHGVLPSFYKYKPSEKKEIEERTVNQNTIYIVKIPEEFDLEEGKWKEKKKSRKKSKKSKNYYFTPVRKVTSEHYSGPVYNLEIKGDHSYTAASSAVSNCQNWTISQSSVDEIGTIQIAPEEAVERTKSSNCQGIAYTYGEPVIWFEYGLDTAKLAHDEGLYNVFVTNGYMNLDAWKELGPYLDGMNVDLKAFSDEFYQNICGVPSVEPVLETCEWAVDNGIHLELTNLLIPGENDDPEQIQEMCRWIAEELGPRIPIHFSRFRPMYKMMDKPSTPITTLEKALEIAEDEGLEHVYVGNVPGHRADNTYCPECGELLIARSGFSISEYNLKDGRCPNCDAEINIAGKPSFGL